MLRHFGHARVAVLDGGLRAWRALEGGESPPVELGDFVAAEPTSGAVVDYEFVRRLDGDVLLLDARGRDRFRGEVAPGDPRTGRIPGAKSAYWEAVNLDDEGRFLPPNVLRQRYAQLGVGRFPETVVYCGSGVQACHVLLGMEIAGLAGKLYPGSWSDWSRHPDAPAEKDTEP